MFDPMKWFGRGYQQVGETDEHPIEVDQISFTSSCSSDGDNEGYVTARESNATLGDTLEQDLISFETGIDGSLAGPSDTSLITETPNDTSTPPHTFPSFSANFRESCVVRNSIFWFNESEVDAARLVLPISNRGRVCRFDDDVDDNHLETLCRTLQITMGLCERNRWLNHMARDPVISALVRELDEEFGASESPGTSSEDAGPSCSTPMHSEEYSESQENGVPFPRPPASSFSSSAGSFQTIVCTGAETSGDLNDTAINGHQNSHSPGIHRTQIPPRPGIQGIEILRRVNETPSSICSAILRQAVLKDEPVDARMVEWMRGFAEVDTWIQEIAPASRKHDKYSLDVPSLPEDWSLTVHKPPPIRQGLESQQWKCAACRQSLHPPISTDIITARFCDYYGLFFCLLCHGGEKSVIPARVINQWVFTEHAVSDRAMRFLRAVRETPVFRIRQLSVDLMKKNKFLKAVVELRQKLKHMEGFIKICIDASTEVFEFGNLSTMFASLDRYLLESDDLFSLNDLQRVHNKDLISLLEPLAKRAREHILNCKRCRLQAPVCVRCNDMTDRLFPFEERAVSRCEGCGSLSHAPKCPRRDVPRDTHCPKCARLRPRTTSRLF